MTLVGMRSRGRLALALICAGLFPGALRVAEPASYRLHIENQPLANALQEFARETGIQILFFSYLTDGKRAPALDGAYTVERAMTELLAGSMLTFRWVNEKTIEIRQIREHRDRAN